MLYGKWIGLAIVCMVIELAILRPDLFRSLMVVVDRLFIVAGVLVVVGVLGDFIYTLAR